jgi:hypothetical protein
VVCCHDTADDEPRVDQPDEGLHQGFHEGSVHMPGMVVLQVARGGAMAMRGGWHADLWRRGDGMAML